MRPPLPVIAVAALAPLAVAAAVASASATTTTRHCAHRAKASIVLRHTATVLAYRDAKRFGARTYACWRPTGRTMRLHTSTGGAATTDIVLDGLAVSGRVVAYHVQATGDRNYSFVRSLDVRSGMRLRRSGTFLESPPAYPLPRVAIATNGRGAVVWLANGVLRALDQDGSRRLALETAGAISGVAAGARTARWTQGAVVHRARLR
jgi:hypothetical protein